VREFPRSIGECAAALCGEIADAYVPYFLYRVKYAGAPARLFAIDAVDGSLDLFEFPKIPVERELLSLDGRKR